MILCFVRVVGGKVELALCNSLSDAREFVRLGWERISVEEFERLETARIERRLTATVVASVLGVKKGA